MADTPRTSPDSVGKTPKSEHDGVRSSNDRDQAAEREGNDAARGRTNVEHEDLGDVDPDSAKSDVDRDDSVTD